jgi:hypothetical protein
MSYINSDLFFAKKAKEEALSNFNKFENEFKKNQAKYHETIILKQITESKIIQVEKECNEYKTKYDEYKNKYNETKINLKQVENEYWLADREYNLANEKLNYSSEIYNKTKKEYQDALCNYNSLLEKYESDTYEREVSTVGYSEPTGCSAACSNACSNDYNDYEPSFRIRPIDAKGNIQK